MSDDGLQELLESLLAEAEQQAPYFDDRLLAQIDNVKRLLNLEV